MSKIKKTCSEKTSDHGEDGAILVVVLVLIFAVTLALLAYLYMNKNNSLIASNLAVQNAAQEATEQGVLEASNLLSQQGANPPTGNISPWYVVPTSGSTRPSAPTASFWQTCAQTNNCGSMPINYGSFSFNVNYVVYPIGPNTTNGTYYYIAYVHAANTNGGGLGVTIEANLEK
ncbi:pilus assembly PilX family protein [Acidithiobacillus sulfurivorans]|uniref:Type 4 fimbrial biogenesis protein PilX N-terminal domain-containing protein n=1 Tax=Acidithiobacillus sulfurivorans TaxID=1958756 RepID=A0ABS6A152_9PROT|nr:hypothetical protein [Acidithiobacillus sulfurivorans]MBU2761222.1 hypothetical protein [Acidithiobacillus sulfurivorans]